MPEQDAVQPTPTPSMLARMWNGLTRDGHLAAAGRQGADEIGQALKAFPDSIGVDEPGTVFNPTQGEIAADREEPLPSPSDIARNKQPYQMEQDHDQDASRGR